MRVDASLSRYSEDPTAPDEFSRDELRHCRTVLRRLQFLETKVRESGGIAASGGAAWSEWEMAGLEWMMTEIGYLTVRESNQ